MDEKASAEIRRGRAVAVRRWIGVVWGILFCSAAVTPCSAAPERQLIAGAGPSTVVVAEFVKFLQGTEVGGRYSFEVPPDSIKHAGGIKSTSKYVFGRTGRPLTEEEKAGGVEEIWLAKMPIGIVAGSGAGVKNLTQDQMCGLFDGKITNWKEVGGADAEAVVFSREPTEALFLELKKELACMNDVVQTRYTFRKDNQVVDMLTGQEVGNRAIAFGAKENFPAEYLVDVEGFEAGVNLGLVYAQTNADHELVAAAKQLARSEEWKSHVRGLGLGTPSAQ